MKRKKIIVFQGGLGNQLFQYAFLCKMRELGYETCYLNNATGSHNGFEIQKYFITDMIECHSIFYRIFKYFEKLYRHGFHFVFSTENRFSIKKSFQYGYWQDLRFLPTGDIIKFKKLLLDDANRRMLKIMEGGNCIAIHVRRGDYLLPPHNKVFAGICTKEYYQKAICIMKSKFDKPKFLFFSNDMEWVKANLHFPNDECFYIDWNVGDKSVLDMYLMSHCCGNILANSTFSFWGARLGNNNVVVYPKKWFNTMAAPNIFPSQWIGI